MDVTTNMKHRWPRLLPAIVCVLLIACGSSGGKSDANGLGKVATLDTLDFDRNATILPWAMLPQATVQFRALGTDRNGVSVDLSNVVTWESSDLDIVTVDAAGEARSVAPGSAKIIATLESASVKKTVSQEVTITAASLVISSPKDFVFTNDVIQMRVFVNVTNRSYFGTDGKEAWGVSNSGIATINEKGMLTAHAAGDVTVSATFLNLKAEYRLSVSEAFVVKASDISNNQIVLDWPPVRGAESYTLTWKTPGYLAGFVSTDVPGLTQTHYVHGGLENDTRYVYSVEAIPKQKPGQWNNQAIRSNELKLNTLSDNSAILSGDTIGTLPEAAITELRHSLKVTVAKPSSGLRIGEAFITRYSTDARTFDVIIPVTNMSEDRSYCNMQLAGEKLRDQSALDIVLPMRLYTFLVGGVRDSGNNYLLAHCISPGRSGYMYGIALASTIDTAQADFLRIAEVYADGWESMFPFTKPAKAAIVPQSYIVLPPVSGSVNQRIEVTVKNVGTMKGAITTLTSGLMTLSKVILLDADNKPLDVRTLSRAVTWDGVLDVNQTNTLFADIYYTGKAQRIEVFVDFSLPQPTK